MRRRSRIIRISDEVRISLEVVAKEDEASGEQETGGEKLTTSKLAQKLGVKTVELTERLVKGGWLEFRDGKNYLTIKGKEAGGEFRMSQKFGPYFHWPENFKPQNSLLAFFLLSQWRRCPIEPVPRGVQTFR